MIFGFCFLQKIFSTVTTNLWKSEVTVSIVDVSWKYLERFIRNKSMHDGLFGFLKQVGSLLDLKIVSIRKSIQTAVLILR